jgi:acetyl-CoA carboxylase biotin carboxylase subunit
MGEVAVKATRACGYRGAAIECRVYAEDPLRFLPSPGTITSLRVPGGPYVRDDSGVVAGSQISVYYDPLISKLIVWGEDRDRAIARMRRALDEYRLGGIKHNLPFHRRLMRHPLFVAGEFDTGFIDREKARLLAPHDLDGDDLEVAIAAAAIQSASTSPPASVSPLPVTGAAPSAWRTRRMR